MLALLGLGRGLGQGRSYRCRITATRDQSVTLKTLKSPFVLWGCYCAVQGSKHVGICLYARVRA